MVWTAKPPGLKSFPPARDEILTVWTVKPPGLEELVKRSGRDWPN